MLASPLRRIRPASLAVLAALALAPLFVVAPRPASAQSEVDLDGLVKDQRAARARIRALREKMERLASKLDREGRGYAAALLLSAVEELEASQIESQMENVATELRESGTLHRSLKLQDELLGDLENLLQILQDRKSLDKIDQILEQMKEALADVSQLKQDEEKLLGETRDASKSEREDMASRASADPAMAALAQKLSDLATRQDELREETEKSISDAMRDAEAALKSLATLKAAQQKALERTESAGGESQEGGESESGESPASGEETTPPGKTGATPPRPSGETPAGRTGEGETPPVETPPGETPPGETPAGETGAGEETPASSEASPEGAAAAEASAAIEAMKQRLEAARERTRDAAEGKTGEDGGDPAAGLHGELQSIAEAAEAEAAKAAQSAANNASSESAGESLEAAAEALREAAESIASEDAEAAGKSEDEALAHLDEAARALSSPSGKSSPRGESSRELRSLRAQASALGAELLQKSEGNRSSGSNSDSPSGENDEFAKASEKMDQAAESLGQAQGKSATGDDAASAEAQREAIRRTEEAEKELTAMLTRLEAKSKEALAATAKAEKELEAAAREAAEAANRASAESAASSPQASKSGAKSASEAEKAAGQMAEAAEALAKGEASKAAESQEAASQSLRRAAEQAAQAAAGPMSEKQKEELRRLQKRQDEIAKKTAELEEKTESLPNSAGQRNLQRAQESMQKASQSLQRGETAKAAEQEDEALKYLNEAQQDIEQRQEEYRNLEQEEILFRVKEKIDGLVTKQRDINIRTLEADVRREQQGGTFTRAQRIKELPNLSTDQKQVRTDVGEIADKLRSEGSPAFTWVLDMVGDDTEALAERIREQDLGEGTRDIQSDVVSRLVSLSEAFKDELQRRQAEQGGGDQQQGGEGGGEQDQRLVPLMTELKMLRHMQLEVLRKRADLMQRIQRAGETGELTREQEALLMRLASQQGSVTEVFRNFKKLVGVD